MERCNVTIDPITMAAVSAVVEREGLTFSAALCQMAVSAGMRQPYVAERVREVVEAETRERMERDGWHPGLSRDLARELLTGESEKLGWN